MLPARPRRRAALACLGLAGTLASGVLAAAAPAAADDTPTGSTSITIFLKAPDEAALDRLAAAQGLTTAQRQSAVSTLVPSEATHDSVDHALRAEGFTVTGETAWSITATGPAARSAAMFGTRPSLGTNPSVARRSAAIGALPRVPYVLSGLVAGVFPTTGGPKVFGNSATQPLNGSAYRNAYAPANRTPTTGAKSAGVTIATLQLANFYDPTQASSAAKDTAAADLSSYAKKYGIADPVKNKTYRAVMIDGGPPAQDDGQGGDVEVNLDQQSILSTAPSAKQQAYFAANTEAGLNDAFAHAYDDVVGNRYATAVDKHIVAFSSSWGACEGETGRASIAVTEPIIKSLVAAGVTVFSASGDAGIYDCGDGTGADVDYPGSSPSVVSVGGTELRASTNKPNTGTNWTETAWSCTSKDACVFGAGGGGGGASGSASNRSDFTGFAAPAYQRVAITNAPFTGNAKRLVPDISADAKQATGFTIYSSNPEVAGPSGAALVGGTSLAAPISAAGLANALAEKGRTTGVGAINGALYSAYARTRGYAATNPAKVFRDVTTGSNGASADRRTDPSVSAGVGYDTVSGLGAVLWPALVPYLLDTHTPTATASIVQPTVHKSSWRDLKASWTVRQGNDLLLPGATIVTITAYGSSTPLYSGTTLPSSSSVVRAGYPGSTYQVVATGQDLDGRRSAPAVHAVQVPVDDSWFTRSGSWQRVKGTADIAGSHLTTTSTSATLSVTRVGTSYRLAVDTGPNSGTLGVYFGGKRVAVVDTHSASYGRKLVTVYAGSYRGNRQLTFKALSSRSVNIDALYVTY